MKITGAFLIAVSFLGAATARNNVTTRDFVIEPPTLINLGFEWFIEGDDNRNASVSVKYRKKGDRDWKQALPLLRIQNERINRAEYVDVIAPNMFAGSILDLEQDTEYECTFQLSDPNGVGGPSTKQVVVRTRPEPKPFAGGRTFHVYPHGFKGTKQEPAFEGLLCAYYLTCSGTDWSTASRPRVKAGDTVLVHAGLYKYNRFEYTNNLGVSTVPFDGTYYLTASGTPEKPIAIKAAGDGEVIFDGNGAFNLFNVKAGNYTYFEGLTIRNTEIAIWAGTQFIVGSKGLTVKHCRFENIGMGVYTNYSGSSNFYIADNWFLGKNDPDHLIAWRGDFWAQFATPASGQVFPPQMPSYIAIKIYGPGHVIAYNYVANFHDGIDIETYGNPDGSSVTEGPKYPSKEYWDRRPVAIDFYNNYMTNFHDNPFETDGGMHNVRVMRNMMINSASHALCNQPSLGGPVYWIRNIAYHLPEGSSRLTNGSAGLLFYNNTILSETLAADTSNTHWRNNLMLGENALPAIFGVNTATSYTSSDYNGFRPNPGAKVSFQWNAPPAGIIADYNSPGHQAKLTTRDFATLAEYSSATGQDQHSILVDYDIFANVRRLDRNDLPTVQKIHKAEDFDFSLKPASAPIDRGLALPNISEKFTGQAPDLGAIEYGTSPPHYGPRPR